ncbi:TlpA family protein disulfide reductase [Pontibacter harenae]|uniref:TlpA family protein disulfide reductase n=1 Tax=Pontibacter harenae TaxID=2894083 RepID=UPI001E309335|nr:TlpA disulfide reductase family protein [Pontibacter harenae]MCC9166459.1 TlpA family protein disulfide reductase [Pontibacter harenae]
MMKHRFTILAATAILCIATALGASAQEVKVIKFDQLEQLRQSPHDTLYVVNFWATWCKPCIKEMPYFEAANQQYQDQPVQVVLVSMDAAQDMEKRVKPFVQKRNLQSRLLLLDETDANTWIDKLEPKWSGAIPATIFFNNKRKQYEFVERELTQEELQNLINKYKP